MSSIFLKTNNTALQNKIKIKRFFKRKDGLRDCVSVKMLRP